MIIISPQQEYVAVDLKPALEKLKEKMVVLLGCYIVEHLEFLKIIQTILEVKFQYKSIILEDMYNLGDGTTISKETPRQIVHNIISSSNFVIADDTVPSGESLELEYCRNCGAITAIICRYHNNIWQRSTFMTSDFTIHSLDFKKFNVVPSRNASKNLKEIEKMLNSIIKWKDARKKEIHDKMKKAYEEYQKNTKPKHFLHKLGL